MLGSQTLLDALTHDPLAFYPALAALLLAAVGIASGMLRGDVLALSRPLPLAWIAAAVAAVWGLERALGSLDPTWATPAGDLALAPLAVIALAYGPTPAVVALALTVAWVGLPQLGPVGASPAQVWLVGLQLIVLGWLAIAPNPRRSWGVAGVYLVVAHVLTWLTAGLAWLALRYGGASLALLELEHGLRFEGLALLSVALALVPPIVWRRLFPGSALAVSAPDAPRAARTPNTSRAEPAADAPLATLAPIEPGVAGPGRRRRPHRTLDDLSAAAPAPLRRPRRWLRRGLRS